MTDFFKNPPWQVMPNTDPVSASWKQGDLEPYMNEWFEFWENLSKEKQAAYLQQTSAPEVWKDYLEFMYSTN